MITSPKAPAGKGDGICHRGPVSVIAAVYCPVSHFGFINFDDNLYVYGNDQVTQGLAFHSYAGHLQRFGAETGIR